ncbi:hypothetical protein SAY87_007333 [Trapa incisa]|uniref:Uncharacterized protein n=1 Tax=Trapa incisa TaxID=236973 RepID=A0AAN7K1L9_9MYRT|nr:hypothetical protein SAY87_007333 [Trapa incisa]
MLSYQPFSKSGFWSNALKTSCFMHSNGVPLDSYDMCSSLTASTTSQSFDFGQQVHACTRTLYVRTLSCRPLTDAKMWSRVLEVDMNMPGLNLSCDNYTYSSILRSCIGLSVVELGRQVHCCAVLNTRYIEDDAFLRSSLIEMHGSVALLRKLCESSVQPELEVDPTLYRGHGC